MSWYLYMFPFKFSEPAYVHFSRLSILLESKISASGNSEKKLFVSITIQVAPKPEEAIKLRAVTYITHQTIFSN
jgi:hypothetical protein